MKIKEKYSDFYILIKYGNFPIELLHEMSEVEITMYAKEIKLKLNK
jgi:hypothetical protein